MFADEILQLRFGHKAHNAVHGLPVFVKHQSWNGCDAESLRDALVLVYVDLGEFHIGHFIGQLFNNWSYHVVRAVSFGLEVYEHKFVFGILGEGIVFENSNSHLSCLIFKDDTISPLAN